MVVPVQSFCFSSSLPSVYVQYKNSMAAIAIRFGAHGWVVAVGRSGHRDYRFSTAFHLNMLGLTSRNEAGFASSLCFNEAAQCSSWR